MRAAVLHGPRQLVIEDRPRPSAADGEVLVRVASVGICGSDTHYFTHGRIGSYRVETPMVLGHETSGVVEAVGAGVSPARIGQRVSVEPGAPCRTCRQCSAGRYNLCPGIRFHATPPVDGTLSEWVAVPADFAHPVPSRLSDDAAALLEPLSVAVWATRKGAVAAGSRVLVTGAGPIGLVAAQTARALGAAEVVVTDVNTARLALARELGASAVVDVSTTDLREAGFEPDVLIECSGSEQATVDGLRVLAPAGHAVLVGMGGEELALPVSLVQERELVLTGVFRYAGTWPAAIALAADGRVDLDRLVSAHFGIDETAKALLLGESDPGAVKAVVRPHD